VKKNIRRGRRLNALETMNLCRIFDDTASIIEEAIAGDSSIDRVTKAMQRTAIPSTGVLAQHAKMMAIGKSAMENMAADNPLVDSAKEYNLDAVSSILEKEEYKAFLAEPDGVAFLLCYVARTVDILAKRDCAKEVAEIPLCQTSCRL